MISAGSNTNTHTNQLDQSVGVKSINSTSSSSSSSSSAASPCSSKLVYLDKKFTAQKERSTTESTVSYEEYFRHKKNPPPAPPPKPPQSNPSSGCRCNCNSNSRNNSPIYAINCTSRNARTSTNRGILFRIRNCTSFLDFANDQTLGPYLVLYRNYWQSGVYNIVRNYAFST